MTGRKKSMNKIRFFVFFVFICFVGCIHQVDRSTFKNDFDFFNKVNDLCIDKEVNIVTKDNNFYTGTNFIISGNNSSYHDEKTASQIVIPIEDIRTISFNSFSSGFLTTSMIGAITGIGFGLFLGQYADSFFGFNLETPGLIYIPATGIIGALIGIAILSIDGYKILIKIN